MQSIIVGTAGHIDHGKTSLVRALTGIDTDRLAEEKRRGISIDLGFAHLDLAPDLRIGFVDVPGHERFVRNMLAGAGGIDLAILAVAADESIKPQTREHFDICRLLGIQSGVVALTKSDRVEPDILELTRLEVEEFIAGSFLEGAPVVPVSAVTGEGLETLKDALKTMAASVSPKNAAGHLRLPIDRSFTMRGFGTVITGTLISGSVRDGQDVEIQPGGRRLRVRGVQVHGEPAQEAIAGQRTALNLAGCESADLGRGMTVIEPGRLRATTAIDCELELLPTAKPLKHRSPVHFHAWTAETEAEIRLFGGDELAPGTTGSVRLLLRDPVLLLPDDRFIVRMFSPVITIGGGRVLDIAPMLLQKRTGTGAVHRLTRNSSRRSPLFAASQKRSTAAARLAGLSKASVSERVAMIVRESGYGMSLAELIARTGLPAAELQRIARQSLTILSTPQPWILDPAWIGSAAAAIERRLADFHAAHPLQPGVPKEDIRSRELPDAPPFLIDALLERCRNITVEGDLLRLATHSIRFHQEEEEAVARIESAFHQAGLSAPSTTEVLARCGVEPGRSRTLLRILLNRGTLVRVNEELVYHADAIGGLRRMISARKGERFNVAAFKEWTGVSRKYAIPLLEYLDREKVTRREGDSRLVL